MHRADAAEKIVNNLHELAGYCGHCGKKKCAGRAQYSKLPATLRTADVLTAIETALKVKL
jgi:hypothetical protein